MKNALTVPRVIRTATWAFLVAVSVGCGNDDPTPPDVDAPPDPVTLEVRAGSLSDTLVWSPSHSADFAAYVVLRRSEPHEGERLLVRLPTAEDTVWIDDTVSPHRFYEYSVRVEDGAGQLSLPDSASVTTHGLDSLAVGLDPRAYVAVVGDTVTVSVWLESASDLFGTVIGLSFDPARVRISDCGVAPWMGEESLLLCQDEPDGATLAISRLGTAPSLDGWGNLATFRVAVLAPGPITIGFSEAPLLLDRTGESLPGSPARMWPAVWTAQSIDGASARSTHSNDSRERP